MTFNKDSARVLTEGEACGFAECRVTGGSWLWFVRAPLWMATVVRRPTLSQDPRLPELPHRRFLQEGSVVVGPDLVPAFHGSPRSPLESLGSATREAVDAWSDTDETPPWPARQLGNCWKGAVCPAGSDSLCSQPGGARERETDL